MKAFFEGVGAGDTAGVWEGDPNAEFPGAAEDFRRGRQPAQEMI